jgi:hypothetical protein
MGPRGLARLTFYSTIHEEIFSIVPELTARSILDTAPVFQRKQGYSQLMAS